MKHSGRAYRRFHKERMKDKARKVYWHDKHAYKLADHLAHCSCPVCGNPRRCGYAKKLETRQEYESELKLIEELKEIGVKLPEAKKRLGKFID